MQFQSHTFCVAPMMDWTDRHCRFFHRLLTRRARLYTEMVTAEAVLHGNRERLLGFSPRGAPRRPAARRLRPGAGWPRPRRIGEGYGYDEINLNVGCPSDRVQEGRFGACLMAEPELVARCGRRHAGARARPRHRQVPHRHRRPGQRGRPGAVRRRGGGRRLPHLHRARAQGLAAGAVAQGEPRGAAARLRPRLSPEGGAPRARDRAQRRHRLARGGRKRTWRTSTAWRWAAPPIRTPTCWPRSIARLFGAAAPAPSRRAVLEALVPYVERHLRGGGRLNNVTRHILGLYHGRPRARAFRRHLSERAPREGAGVEVLLRGHPHRRRRERAGPGRGGIGRPTLPGSTPGVAARGRR